MYAGKKLKSLRQTLDINQEDFAKAIGLSQPYYSAVESGKKPISKKMIDKIYQNWKGVAGYFEDGYNSELDTALKGVELGGIIGGDKNSPMFNRSYEENEIAFYLNHTEQRLDGILAVAFDEFKDIFTALNKLIIFSEQMGAPEFIKEKYQSYDFKKYNEEMEEEIEEELGIIKDSKVLKCVKITRYKSDIEHFTRSTISLINYMSMYSDMYLGYDKAKLK